MRPLDGDTTIVVTTDAINPNPTSNSIIWGTGSYSTTHYKWDVSGIGSENNLVVDPTRTQLTKFSMFVNANEVIMYQYEGVEKYRFDRATYPSFWDAVDANGGKVRVGTWGWDRGLYTDFKVASYNPWVILPSWHTTTATRSFDFSGVDPELLVRSLQPNVSSRSTTNSSAIIRRIDAHAPIQTLALVWKSAQYVPATTVYYQDALLGNLNSWSDSNSPEMSYSQTLELNNYQPPPLHFEYSEISSVSYWNGVFRTHSHVHALTSRTYTLPLYLECCIRNLGGGAELLVGSTVIPDDHFGVSEFPNITWGVTDAAISTFQKMSVYVDSSQVIKYRGDGVEMGRTVRESATESFWTRIEANGGQTRVGFYSGVDSQFTAFKVAHTNPWIDTGTPAPLVALDESVTAFAFRLTDPTVFPTHVEMEFENAPDTFVPGARVVDSVNLALGTLQHRPSFANGELGVRSIVLTQSTTRSLATRSLATRSLTTRSLATVPPTPTVKPYQRVFAATREIASELSPFLNISFPTSVITNSLSVLSGDESNVTHTDVTNFKGSPIYLNLICVDTVNETFDGISETHFVNDMTTRLIADSPIVNMSIRSLDFTIRLEFEYPFDGFVHTTMKHVDRNFVETSVDLVQINASPTSVNYLVQADQNISPGELVLTTANLYEERTQRLLFDNLNTLVDYDVRLEEFDFHSIVANVVAFDPEVNKTFEFKIHTYDTSRSDPELERVTSTNTSSVYPMRVESIDKSEFRAIDGTSILSILSFAEETKYRRYQLTNLNHSTLYMFQFELEDTFARKTTLDPVFVKTPSIPDISQVTVTQNGYELHMQAAVSYDGFPLNTIVTWYYVVTDGEVEPSEVEYTSVTLPFDAVLTIELDTDRPLHAFESGYKLYVRFTFGSSYGLLSAPTRVEEGNVLGIRTNAIQSHTAFADSTVKMAFAYQEFEPLADTSFDLTSVSFATFSTTRRTLTPSEYTLSRSNDLVTIVVSADPFDFPAGYAQLNVRYTVGDQTLVTSSNIYDTVVDLVGISSVDVFVRVNNVNQPTLHVENFVDDAPIPKRVVVRSLTNLDLELANTSLTFPYPTIPDSVVQTTYEISWSSTFYDQIVPSVSHSMTQVGDDSVYRIQLRKGDTVTFVQTSTPLYEGTYETDTITRGTQLTNFENDRATIQLTDIGSRLFHHNGPTMLVVNVVEGETAAFESGAFAASNEGFGLNISSFDLNYDIFQIDITDALERKTTLYHPDVSLGRLKTSSVSTNLNVSVGNISFQYDVENFVSIPSLSVYTVVHELFAGPELLQTRTSSYENGSNETIVFDVSHAHTEYSIQSNVIKGSQFNVHDVGTFMINPLDTYSLDRVYKESQVFDTTGLLISTAVDGIFCVGLMTIATDHIPVFADDTTDINLAVKDTVLFGTSASVIYAVEADDVRPVQMDNYAIAFNSLNGTNRTIINRSLAKLDVDMYCDADIVRQAGVHRIHLGLVVFELTNTDMNELRFKHKVSSIVVTMSGGGSQVIDLNLMNKERQSNVSFTTLSFLSSNNTTYHPTVTNLNGTMMNRTEAMAIYETYIGDPTTRTSYEFP